jgi:carboxypeptidase C (cathepsin A)
MSPWINIVCILVVLSTTLAIPSDRVESLPGIGRLAQKTYAGFINVNQKYGAYLYYYFVESQNKPTDPVVLWLQGGPGCSSLFGCFVENGPILIRSDGSFVANPWSWTTNSSMLWIDSPVGSGYSYVNIPSGYATNERTIAEELYIALYTFFFQLHPEYSKLPFYIFGESYAGKYVPWLTWTVIEKNANATNKINLKGIGIGNGWVNPYYQTGSYGPFLYANGLINAVELDAAIATYILYKGLIDIGAYVEAEDIGNLLLETLMAAAGGIEPYDIRKTRDPTDPLQAALQVYLNRPDVKKKMNAGNAEWQMCNPVPLYALLGDLARSAEKLFPKILATKLPVLLYNGNYDLICNYFGTNDWTNAMEWPYSAAWHVAKNQTWTVSGQLAGYYRSASSLTQLVVDGAGHMVPFDQGRNAHAMLYQFMQGFFHPELGTQKKEIS